MSDNFFLQFKRGFHSKHNETIQKIIRNSSLRISSGKESTSNMTHSTFIDIKPKINSSHDFKNILQVLGLNKQKGKQKITTKESNQKFLKEKRILRIENN